MININIFKKFNGQLVANLHISDRVTIVAGDTSTGKTHICSMLEEKDGSAYRVEAYDSKMRKVSLYYCSSLNRFKEIMYDESKNYSVVFIDEYVATELNKLENKKDRGYMDLCCKYFVIFQRDSIIKYHIGVNSVFKVTYKNKIYNFEKILTFNDEYNLGNITKCNIIISEDSKSGFKILEKYFEVLDKMHVVKGNGNGDIHKDLCNYSDQNIICGLDYDKGSWALYNIHSLIADNSLNANKIYFIKMESIEEVLCNSNLILNKCPNMRDYVENIEKHMDCSFKHRGEYFMYLLKIFFITAGGKPKYNKDRPHCFVVECNDCNSVDCKFRNTAVEKVKLVFCNKYELLHKLYEYLHN